jgi:hypothetical protein
MDGPDRSGCGQKAEGVLANTWSGDPAPRQRPTGAGPAEPQQRPGRSSGPHPRRSVSSGGLPGGPGADRRPALFKPGSGAQSRGGGRGCSSPAAPSPLDEEHSAEELATVNSADYAAIVKAYTNKKGEISYELLNKALIQAARSNPYVAEMVGRKATLEEIRDHVVKTNFEAVTGNRSLSLAEVHRILELLDEVSPRSVLRDLNDDLRKMLA